MKSIVVQTALSAGLMLVAALAPPARGAMIAVPFGETPAHRLLAEKGVGLLGVGPLPGSIVIDAQDIPFAFAFSHRILLMRGHVSLCSGKRSDVRH
ncbi:hypothetical protein BH10PSE13_BH10PSE13_07860 [soil metagenome]